MLIIINTPKALIGAILAVKNEANPTMVVTDATKIVGNIALVELKTRSLGSSKSEE